MSFSTDAESGSLVAAVLHVLPGIVTILACLAAHVYFRYLQPHRRRLQMIAEVSIEELSAQVKGSRCVQPGGSTPPAAATFDAIVIGGGSGGYGALRTIVDRLSEQLTSDPGDCNDPGHAGVKALGSSGSSKSAGKARNKTWKVVLVEPGPFSVGDAAEAPQYRQDMVGLLANATKGGLSREAAAKCSDWSAVRRVQRPLASAQSGDRQGEEPDGERRLQVYPRGAGLGGTSLIDHRIRWLSASSGPSDGACSSGAPKKSALTPASLCVNRNPLSWAFAEACKKIGLAALLPSEHTCDASDAASERRHLSDSQGSSVYPLLLEIDAARNGVNQTLFKSVSPPCSRYNRNGAADNVEVIYLRGFVDHLIFNESDPLSVRSIIARSSTSPKRRVDGSGDSVELFLAERTGCVILCGGALGSRELVARSVGLECSGSVPRPRSTVPHPQQQGSVLHPWTARARRVLSKPLILGDNFFDVVAVPLIYEARPGLSDDKCNTRTVQAFLAWYTMGKGPLTGPLIDTAATLKLPSQDGSATESVTVLFEPSGAISRSSWHQLVSGGARPDHSLLVFKEAFTFWIVAAELPAEPRCSESGPEEPHATDAMSIGSRGNGIGLLDVTVLGHLQERLLRVLVKGIQWCRDLAQTEPLRSLSSGREAIDTSLFRNQDDGAAIRKLLYGTQTKAKTRPVETPVHQQEVDRLKQLAWEEIQSGDYLQAYARKHAAFLGYSCGTLASADKNPQHLSPPSCSLWGSNNVFIGDASGVVPVEQPAEAPSISLLVAGSSAAATLAGIAAAEHCVEKLRQPS